MEIEDGHVFYLVSFQPELGWEERFNEWYNIHHLPELLRCPGFNAAWRFEAIEGSPRFVALFDVDGMEAFESPAYLALKNRTPEQFQAIAQEVLPHCEAVFSAKYRQIVRQHAPETTAQIPRVVL